ncbi:hypothetical protein FBEOM_1962 [Fusarium beomiforme]|uniref:Uncharacterized protein n=1 Tax=Fusarium beomiforme TaxID=44412 RepID=A0A9P5ASD8_9HYPO|nr:hypothetical protein FBEOM_1962 [Fusarium beomiforme]
MSKGLPFAEYQLAQPVRLTYFHKFPDLPLDLRLLIWEAALRPPPSENYNAVHKFADGGTQGIEGHGKVVNRGLSLKYPDANGNFNCYGKTDIPFRVPLPPGKDVARGGKTPAVVDRMSGICETARSTYFWDYGMWTACNESRRVINRRFKKNQWSEIREDVVKDVRLRSKSHRQPWRVQRAWEKENRDKDSSNKTIGRQEWYKDFVSVFGVDNAPGNLIATHPAKDLFIIEDTRWWRPEAIIPPIQDIQETAIFFFRDNNISPTRRGYPMIGNMGFVYHNSWCEGIAINDPHPTLLSDQVQTKNPRDEKEEKSEEEEGKEKKTKEKKTKEKKEPKVFYNYGEEDLVEVDVKPNVVMRMNGNEQCVLGNCCGFTYYLSNDRIVVLHTTDPNAEPFNVWDHVGVLAPRSRVPGKRIRGG